MWDLGLSALRTGRNPTGREGESISDLHLFVRSRLSCIPESTIQNRNPQSEIRNRFTLRTGRVSASRESKIQNRLGLCPYVTPLFSRLSPVPYARLHCIAVQVATLEQGRKLCLQ